MIAAVSENGVIARNGALPWRVPTDVQYFLDKTLGKTVLTGRKTFETIVAKRGSSFQSDRRVYVLTRDVSYTCSDVTILHDIADVDTTGDVWVVGGGEIYGEMIEDADRLYITEIHTVVDGDTYFPAIDKSVWHEISREPHKADTQNEFDFDFIIYERK